LLRASLILTVVLAACSAGESEILPPEALQVWRTDAPGYRDRSFELRDGWVVFGTGYYTHSIHAIDSVEVDAETETVRLEVAYRADDGESVPLRLVFTPGDPPALRIGSRSDVWVPEAHARWLKGDTP
jgi:hypothetical protein